MIVIYTWKQAFLTGITIYNRYERAIKKTVAIYATAQIIIYVQLTKFMNILVIVKLLFNVVQVPKNARIYKEVIHF